MPLRVLLIDDDQRLASMLVTWMRTRGVELVPCFTAAAGRASLRHPGQLDALVLDLMLPDADGLDLCRELRAGPAADLPVVMLTARGDPEDRVLGLELGADDYLPKPFDPRELLARIRALLRRSHRVAAPAQTLRFGALLLDRGALQASRHGDPLPLTAHQFQLLWALASRAGRVLDRAQLGAIVGDGPGDSLDRTIDVHISRIRAAIEAEPRRPRLIRTVRGAGYLFVAPGEVSS